ncbi:MAG: co-chaperone GroES [Candidatus Taylorbacteria bacterium]|nr:co-chaperone GroES [Candidatus Taylorbacteria bacterium]
MAKPTKKVIKVSSAVKTTQSDNSKVKPLADRVLVRELKKEGERSVSGIIIPETVGEDRGARKGEVIAVGPGKFDDGVLVPMSVKVGDKVLFQWGDKLTIDGEEYEMVNESAILALIK